MSFLGGLVGGVIGGLFAGPWGALLGATVGAAVPSGGDRKETAPASADPLYGLILLFECMAKLSKADGRVTPDEAAFVSSLLKTFGETKLDRSILKNAFDRAKSDSKPFSSYLHELAPLYDERGRIAILEIFCGLARVDGMVSSLEMSMLRQAENAFRLHGCVDAFFRRADRARASSAYDDGGFRNESDRRAFANSSSLKESYELLGCEPSDSDQTIKRAWRKKALEFHPDKLMGKGLSESFIELADREMKKINKAYETIMAARGRKI